MRKQLQAWSWIVAAGLLAAAPPLAAQAPDATAPVQKSVCDVFKADDLTEGLYEFCVVFCEAGDALPAETPAADQEKAMNPRDKGPSRLCLGFWAAVPNRYGPPKSWRIYETE